MLNHKRPRQTSWSYSDEKKGFIIESLEDIPRGEPVFDSYGKKCNSRFFLNYGFIVENNDGNEVPLKVYFNPGDKIKNFKQDLLKSDIEYKSFRVSEDLAEKNMNNFFGFLRFVEYDDNPIQLYKVRD
jgi:protein-histidine N-methyltransferase